MGKTCSVIVIEEECIYDVGGRTRLKETSRKIKT
jgi:hypothetical protein